MLPKTHIILGFVFSYILYWFTSITIFQAILIFLSAVLIDFDHYLWYALRKKDYSLKKAYFWHKKNLHSKNHKPIMHIFHTVEFHIFTALLIFTWQGFLFIFIGMLFHSILDLIDLINRNLLSVREFSLVRYLVLRRKYFKKYF